MALPPDVIRTKKRDHHQGIEMEKTDNMQIRELMDELENLQLLNTLLERTVANQRHQILTLQFELGRKADVIRYVEAKLDAGDKSVAPIEMPNLIIN